MKSWLIFPSLPTGNNRQIELAGIDLWTSFCVNEIFVYPSDLNIDRLIDALGRTLSQWPLVAGRFLLLDGKHYVIEMSDNGIPVSLIENTELSKWPLNWNVVLDNVDGRLPAFLDEVQGEKVVRYSPDESLFRLKITHLVQSDEWVMGCSWSHVLGDACACSNFLHTLSRIYQQLGPPEPSPVFERRLWRKDEADQSLLSTMRHLSDTLSTKQYLEFMTKQTTYDQLNLHFSGKQLLSLRKLVLDSSVTTHDVLIAYIILTLNIHCFSTDEERILHTSTVVNYRGVSDSIASSNLAANCSFRVWSDNFDDPYSLSSIAKALRCSIIRSRNPKFIERFQATADGLMRDIARDNRKFNPSRIANEIIINSNFRYDWASLVDFGHTDKCRFYTDGTRSLCLRVFRLNPMYDGIKWVERDREGAEVAFCIEPSKKQKFVNAWHQDINENFINVKR